jgi:hypothetical protein
MKDKIKTITQLTDEWYKLIGKDHHKDRDCHFYINTVWSYGQDPVYRVEHYGYLVDEIQEDFHSYDEAISFLEKKLKEIIKQEEYSQERERQESFDFLRE